MLRGKLIDRLSTNADDLIIVNSSRCLRMRFDDNENKCSRCTDCCPLGSIDIERLEINRKVCTECMLCVSECPSEGIEISQFNFYSIILKLRKVPNPMLGCNKEEVKAHVNSFCMGLLSEEHIISLLVFLNEPLQINLTNCKDCKNGFIVDVLKKRVESVLRATHYALNKIALIEDKSTLQYKDIPCDRRSFFSVLKSLSLEGVQSIASGAAEPKGGHAFSEEALPFKRRLLNKAFSLAESKLLKDGIIKNYYYDLAIDDNCNMCSACVGMCPTGAIEEDYGDVENSPRKLLFSTSLCVGCNLCADFCEEKALKIKKGFPLNNPFDKKCVKEEIAI